MRTVYSENREPHTDRKRQELAQCWTDWRYTYHYARDGDGTCILCSKCHLSWFGHILMQHVSLHETIKRPQLTSPRSRPHKYLPPGNRSQALMFNWRRTSNIATSFVVRRSTSACWSISTCLSVTLYPAVLTKATAVHLLYSPRNYNNLPFQYKILQDEFSHHHHHLLQ